MTHALEACTRCGFGVDHPIARLEGGNLGLLPDARLVGRCVLVAHGHEEHFEQLAPEVAARFMADAARAARAIREVTGVSRINYAMFCNQVPHLHLHLIPRGGAGDPDPQVSAWELSPPEPILGPAQVESLRDAIATAIDRAS